jgi:hypothetical protein
VLRRSTELVPSLLAMAFREWWYGPDANPAGPQAPAPAGAGIRGGPQLPAERRGQPVEQERFGAGQSHGEEDPDLTGFGPARLSGA